MMTYTEYREAMRECGFPDHEIELCWQSESRFRILEAAIADGERDLSCSTEDYA